MSGSGLERTVEQAPEGFLPGEETLRGTANFLLHFYSISLFLLLSVSQTRRKTGRGQEEEENLTCLDTAHVCLLKNSGQYQLWPAFTEEARVTSCARIVGVCADA